MKTEDNKIILVHKTNVDFQPLKAYLKHSKVHRMFPMTQLCFRTFVPIGANT